MNFSILRESSFMQRVLFRILFGLKNKMFHNSILFLVLSATFVGCQKVEEKQKPIRIPSLVSQMKKSGVGIQRELTSDSEVIAARLDLTPESCKSKKVEELPTFLPDEIKKDQVSRLEMRDYINGYQVYVVIKSTVSEILPNKVILKETSEGSFLNSYNPLFVKDQLVDRTCTLGEKTSGSSVESVPAPLIWQCSNPELKLEGRTPEEYPDKFRKSSGFRLIESKCDYTPTENFPAQTKYYVGLVTIAPNKTLTALVETTDQSNVRAVCSSSPKLGPSEESVTLRQVRVYAKIGNFNGDLTCSKGSLVYRNLMYLRPDGSVKESLEDRLLDGPTF